MIILYVLIVQFWIACAVHHNRTIEYKLKTGFSNAFAGGVSTALSHMIALPIGMTDLLSLVYDPLVDVVKTSIHVNNDFSNDVVATASKLISENGVGVLTRGAESTLLVYFLEGFIKV